MLQGFSYDAIAKAMNELDYVVSATYQEYDMGGMFGPIYETFFDIELCPEYAAIKELSATSAQLEINIDVSVILCPGPRNE